MIVARIHKPDREDRYIPLELGRHIFGSKLGCDVVLLDDGLADEHFQLSVDSKSVSVKLLNDSKATISRDDTENQVDPGVEQDWILGDIFMAGQISIRLLGDPLNPSPKEKQSRLLPLVKFIEEKTSVFASSIVIVVLLAGAGAVSWIRETPIEEIEGIANSAVETPKLRASTAHISTSANSTTSTTADLDPRNENFAPSPQINDGKEVEITSNQTSATYEDSLPSARSERNTEHAIKMILQSFDQSIEIASFNAGKLTLSGLVDDKPTQKKVIRTVVQDVNAVNEVIFLEDPFIIADSIGKDIVGLWAGDRPYVAMRNGETLRPGEEMGNEIRLKEVNSNGIVVQVRDQTKQIGISK